MIEDDLENTNDAHDDLMDTSIQARQHPSVQPDGEESPTPHDSVSGNHAHAAWVP